MKTEVIFILCCIILQGAINTISAKAIAEEKIPLLDAEIQCIRDLGLNEERISKLDEQEIGPENDDEYNKYVACAWKKAKLQYGNGTIDYGSLKDHLEDSVASQLADEKKSVIAAGKRKVRRAITYCQQHPPGGISHGQIVVKLLNCIMNKLDKM